MGYPYPGYYPPPKPAGRLYGYLGFFVALGILYLFFMLSPTQYPIDQAALIGLGAIFAGGFISRAGKRGATIGFLLLFLPLITLGLILFLAVVSPSVSEAIPGLPGIVQALGEGIGRAGVAALGFGLMILAFIAGIVGAIVGGLGGWISGKIFPLERVPEQAGYDQSWQHPPGQGGGPW